MLRIHALAVAVLALGPAGASAVGAQAVPAPGEKSETRSFVTKHTGTFNGEAVRYTATVGETVLEDEEGRPTASLFTIAYVREDVADRAARPVLFIFNGGPSVSSATFHMAAFGPRRVVVPDDVTAPITYEVTDNQYTVLDVADMVFVDPVGAGYSRALEGVAPESFFHARRDARSIARLVETWSQANEREASPKYVVGQSYGTVRAPLMLDLFAEETRIDGLVLISQAVNLVETVQRAGNIVGYATNLPALASIAAYHGRSDRGPFEQSAIIDEAYEFGMGEYLTALARGRDLPAGEREWVARRLEELTGVSAGYYLANDLLITKEEFRRELLRDQGLIVGRQDARYVGPVEVDGEPAEDPFSPVTRAFALEVTRHLTEVLEVTLEQDYLTSGSVSGGWDYGGPSSPFADYDWAGIIARAMEERPELRLMIGTGIFDTQTTVGPARYLLARGGFPADRVVSHEYHGGHAPYTHEPTLRALMDDIRSFLAGGPEPDR